MSISIVFCDEHSLDRTVDHLVSFENGHMGERYPTPYETFRRLRDQDPQAEVEVTQPPAKQTSQSKPPPSKSTATDRPRKLSWKEQRELEHLESRIETLEIEQAHLAEAINRSGNDYLKLQELSEQLQCVESELATAMDRWLELSEIAAGNVSG